MKKVVSVIALVLVAILTIGCFAGCDSNKEPEAPVAGSDTTTVPTGKTYLVVADNSFAPFDFLDEATGKYTGIDMDILAAVAADQGFNYTVDNCGWNAALGNLNGGQADGMIAGMTITTERTETYDFSAPYFNDGQIMFTKKDSTLASFADLSGKKVAVKTGTQGATYAESIADEYGFTIESFDGSDAVYAAVLEGNADAGIEDYSVINFRIKSASLDLKTFGDKVNEGPYGFAVLKGNNAELIEMFNAGLENIKANGKYEEILAKYGM